MKIVHDYLQTTDNGYVLNVYLARNSDVEFDEEAGRFARPELDETLFAYIRRRYPQTPINQVRVVTGDGQVQRLSYMSVIGDVRP